MHVVLLRFNYVTEKRYVTLFGNIVFTEVIKLK